MGTWLDYELPEEEVIDEDEGGLTRSDILRRAVVATAAIPLLGNAGTAFAARPLSLAQKRGGRLRIGVVGGGASEQLDFNLALGEIDVARTRPIYEGLTDFDANGKIVRRLAKQLAPNANATVWLVTLRRGVTFHNGKELTADDVVYTLRYILDPANKAQGAAALTGLKPSNVRKRDKYTVELRLDAPNSLVPTILAERTIKIFPEGTTAQQLADQPVGTGPFQHVSWTRGERSLAARFDNYWRSGRPFLDELEVISISEPSARLNALIGGQIDALAQLDPKQVRIVTGNSKLRLLEKPSGAYAAQYMRLDRAPFDDNRVRQAMRYLVDRKQMVQQALNGHGKIGNDLPSWFDADYAREIPQRPYDPERARSLLRQAGRSDLTVVLHTSDVAPGILDSSTLLAEQAKRAGVTIRLKKYPADSYWSGPYLKVPFAGTDWGGRPLLPQIQLQTLSKAPYNETEWRKPSYDRLIQRALAQPNPAKRRKLMVDAQRMLWDEGGYIIWGFRNALDASSTRVRGLFPSVIRPLGYYDFTNTYLA